MTGPDPFREIRQLSLRPVQGANFWSSFPVTRLDLVVGAFDEISSAEVPGFTETLLAAFPGLVEHRCSIGERGGFLVRLRRGTYAPHIVEHLALELQSLVGHDVGYGRARGGDREGEYTVVTEHRHAAVGAAAASAAVDVVQRVFAGVPLDVDAVVRRLRAAAETPDLPRPGARIVCGITGSGPEAVRDELVRLGVEADGLVPIAPREILEHGLPYARSELAVILDPDPGDVPGRYRDPELAQRLLAVVADAVPRDGLVVVPAKEWEIQELVRDAGCRVAIFSAADDVTRRDARLAHAVAHVRDGRVVLECAGCAGEGVPLRAGAPPAAQAAAVLARSLLAGAAPMTDTTEIETEADVASR